MRRSVEALPSPRELLDSAGLRADRAFGQHFLLDLNICRKIARIADVSQGSKVLEVGPGPGGLTRALLEAGSRVVAVEKDARFLPLLARLAELFPEQLEVSHSDALDLDEIHSVGAGADIVSNLPYNVATPLLVKWLTGPLRPRAMTLMFQAEVARRIVAPVGDADYGRLAVLAQATSRAELAFTLPARAFTPPPKVNSAVVRLTPLVERPDDDLLTNLQTVTAAAFGQRRKMLRSSLKSVGGAALAEAAGLDPQARAETVGVAGFLAMARLIGRR